MDYKALARSEMMIAALQVLFAFCFNLKKIMREKLTAIQYDALVWLMGLEDGIKPLYYYHVPKKMIEKYPGVFSGLSEEDARTKAEGILSTAINIFWNAEMFKVELSKFHLPTSLAHLLPVDQSYDGKSDQERLRMSLAFLEVSTRTKNLFVNIEAEYVGDIVTRTEKELLGYRNFGLRGLNELRAVINALGFDFGWSKDEPAMAEYINWRKLKGGSED